MISSDFAVAEKFHRNFYHDFMEDFELESDRPKVRAFVGRVLELVSAQADMGGVKRLMTEVAPEKIK